MTAALQLLPGACMADATAQTHLTTISFDSDGSSILTLIDSLIHINIIIHSIPE